MREAARSILEFANGITSHEFQTNDMLRSAIERKLEIIGEAANRIPEDYQESHPDISWRKVISQRNIVIHEYDEIREEIIWDIVTKHIQPLIDSLDRLLPQD